MDITAESISAQLTQALDATDVAVVDTSGGCGSSFEVGVISAAFEGKPVIARHRLVHEALKEQMPHIHALSVKRAWTPAQQAAQQQKAAAGS